MATLTLVGTGTGTFTFNASGDGPDFVPIYDIEVGDPVRLDFNMDASLQVTATPNDDIEALPYRADLQVTMTMPQPAMYLGQPFMPDQGWAIIPATHLSTDAAFVTTKPLPKVPTILTRPDAPTPSSGGSGGFVWKASDITSGGNNPVTTWPEEGDGPSFKSKGYYRPNLHTRSVVTKNGQVKIYDDMVVFDYKNVEHMWVDIGSNLEQPFTWLMCGMILSYPSARYGHYLLDHGKDPGSNGRNFGFTHKVGGETGHRSAMLFQKRSALVGTTYPTIETGPYCRCKHDYTPQPRMFYGVFNGSNSAVGVRGRNYHKRDTGTVIETGTVMRKFVVGRRNGYTSTDLASHIGLFEIRFFAGALGKKRLQTQYSYFAKKYDFAKYKI
jgi:hypothetical protein